MKRKGSAAIVPLFLAIVLLFWTIMFFGNPSDTLFEISNDERMKNIQQKMVLPAAKKAFEMEISGDYTEEEIDIEVNAYVNSMVQKNQLTN